MRSQAIAEAKLRQTAADFASVALRDRRTAPQEQHSLLEDQHVEATQAGDVPPESVWGSLGVAPQDMYDGALE